MKTLLTLLTVISLIGCGPSAEEKQAKLAEETTKVDPNSNPLHLVVINFDGCEYVLMSKWSKSPSITHKGNCKYCIKRLIQNN